MAFALPALPFKKNALVPYISEETIDYHYGKHHKTYVDNLNKIISGTQFTDKDLLLIIKTAKGPLFNNAAQVWNHTFYWQCLKPAGKEELSEPLLAAINKIYGSLDKFKAEFTKTALSLFGSGWVWLVKDKKRALSIIATGNAENPLPKGQTPLLTCDVWEHAYYIDYRNARAKYLEAFWHIVNWQFVSQNFSN
jgi:superoxide dismutase, Fe-Mn family